MTFNKTLLTATMLTLGGFAAMSANAANSSEFGVTLNLTATCSVDATKATIAFADQSAAILATGTVATSTGAIEVTCSKDAPYTINLTTGNVPSATGTGQMNHSAAGSGAGNANKITYQLYSDVDGTTPWGNDGVAGTPNTGVGGTGAGLSAAVKTHKVYAKMTSPSDVLLGVYSDIVTAAIVY